MRVRIFTQVMEVQPGIFSFVRPADGMVTGELDEQAAAHLAQAAGAPIKRSFQSTVDTDGCYLIGVRYKPVAIVVPEGAVKFDSGIILSRKLPK